MGTIPKLIYHVVHRGADWMLKRCLASGRLIVIVARYSGWLRLLLLLTSGDYVSYWAADAAQQTNSTIPRQVPRVDSNSTNNLLFFWMANELSITRWRWRLKSWSVYLLTQRTLRYVRSLNGFYHIFAKQRNVVVDHRRLFDNFNIFKVL